MFRLALAASDNLKLDFEKREAQQLVNFDDANKQMLSAVAGIFGVIIAIKFAYSLYANWNSRAIKEKSLKFGLWLPLVGSRLQAKIDSQLLPMFAEMKADVDKQRQHWPVIQTLPDAPTDYSEILHSFDDLQKNYHRGKVSGAVYTEYTPELKELMKDVYEKTHLTNGLHNHWPLLHKMKAEIISWCQDFLHGTSSGHGIITHGGSTSIIEACFTYVRYARETKGIDVPEIIVPDTAHVAFDKAAELLHAKIIRVPVNPKTGKADVAAMQRAISKKTCLLVGSAPSYPFGVIDPIPEIATLAKKYNIACHVDGCLGGPQTALAKKAGFEHVPYCDFSISGVTSISFDTHKYLEAPKGNSVLVFAPDYPATPTQAYLDSVCGMYVTDTMDGSDNGDRIATLHALLRARGKAYYIESIRKILQLQKDLTAQLKTLDGIEVAFDPQLSVVGFKPKANTKINILLVAEKFQERNWSVNIVELPNKSHGFHFCLTSVHTNVENFVSMFVNDMHAAVLAVKQNPNQKPRGMNKAYGVISEGIPEFLLKRIGEAYIRIQNTIPGVSIPGIWKRPETSVADAVATPARATP